MMNFQGPYPGLSTVDRPGEAKAGSGHGSLELAKRNHDRRKSDQLTSHSTSTYPSWENSHLLYYALQDAFSVYRYE